VFTALVCMIDVSRLMEMKINKYQVVAPYANDSPACNGMVMLILRIMESVMLYIIIISTKKRFIINYLSDTIKAIKIFLGSSYHGRIKSIIMGIIPY
jgi:hypothetical protein